MRFVTLALAFGIVCGGPLAAQDHAEDGARQLTLDTAPVRRQIAIDCVFATECYETEPCAESGFAVTLDGRAGGMTPDSLAVEAALISDAQTVPMLGVLAEGVLALSGGDLSARHFLTRGAGGDARLSVHTSDPVLAIGYFGTCREAG